MSISAKHEDGFLAVGDLFHGGVVRMVGMVHYIELAVLAQGKTDRIK